MSPYNPYLYITFTTYSLSLEYKPKHLKCKEFGENINSVTLYMGGLSDQLKI